MTLLILIHIATAVISLIAGFLSMFLRKGSGMHAVAGSVFVLSMLTMSGTAVFLALFHKPNLMNVVAGSLTFYVVTTAWVTGKRREKTVSRFDLAAMVAVFAISAIGYSSGVVAAASPRNALHGMPPQIYFVFGTFALLFALSDLRIYRNGGVEGKQRLVRHLWRMGFALLITAMSFYPGQARQFSPELRKTGVLFAPLILAAATTLYWLVRVKFARRLASFRAGVPVSAAPQAH